MIFIKKIFINIFFLTFTFTCYSQTSSNLLSRGNAFLYQSKADSAIYYYNKLLKDNHSISIKGDVFIKLASAYRLKEDYNKAQSCLFQSQEIFSKLNNDDKLTESYIALAELRRVLLDFIGSKRYLNNAEKLINNKNISYYTKAYYWNRKASVETEYYKNYKKSIVYSNNSLKFSRLINDRFLIAISLNEIGFCYENIKPEKAEEYYKKSLAEFKKIGNFLYSANVLLNLTRLYAKQDIANKQRFSKLSQAKDYIEEGIDISLKMNYKNFQKEFFILKSYYLEKAGDYKGALYYSKESQLLEIKELQKKWDDKLIEQERKFQFDRAEKELKIQKLINVNQNIDLKNTNRTYYIVLYFSILITILSLIAVFLYYKSRKANRVLNFLSSENEFLLREANHRINNNLQIIIILISNKLKQVASRDKESINKILKNVEAISTLHRHLYKNNDKRRINLKDYLLEINDNFSELFNENEIQCNFYSDNVDIDSGSSMYFGLLLSELYINSIKYAFNTQQKKTISFSLTIVEGNIKFLYKDNGLKGFDVNIIPKLIDQLSKQLKINYTIKYEKGFAFCFMKEIYG